jgi:AraC-like DNA-binding protein
VTVDIGSDQEEMVPRNTASTLREFAVLCCEPHIELLSDPASFSLTHRVRGIGPLTIGELAVGSDLTLDCGESCGAYRVNVIQAGRLEAMHRGLSVNAGPGNATVYQPEGRTVVRWAAGSSIVSVNIDRDAVENALSDALGREVLSQVDFQFSMRTATGAAQTWLNMLMLFNQQLSRPGSLLTRPLVGLPFADSLVRGLLLAADHPHRDAVAAEPKPIASRAIRAAVDIIEAEPQQSLTLSTLASRSHVSVRSLQNGFRRDMDTSPMAYLREVRLRRAHQALLQADPSTDTVTAIAHQWGFTNPGRFAAEHTARYGEPPRITLRRSAFQYGIIRSSTTT